MGPRTHVCAAIAHQTRRVTRSCPNCGAPNPLDLSNKCKSCKKSLPTYCFACFAPVREKDVECAACGQPRWVFGAETELSCVNEGKEPKVRTHGFMRTFQKAGKPVHEWRCLQCFAQELLTDPFTHFPDRVRVEA